MQKITHPTMLPPVVIARLLEQHGSPLAPLAEEIYDLAIAYRIDAAFALAHCIVESQLGCKHEAQINCNAALVRAVLTRLAAPGSPLRPADTTEPILPSRYSDDNGSGYVTYPSWLTGMEVYFRLLRLVFVNAWHEEKVEQIAQAFLATMPGRRRAPNVATRALTGAVATLRATGQGQSGEQPGALPVSQQELEAYVHRIERYRAQFRVGALVEAPTGQQK